jgi:hypothetical protein
MTSRRRGPAAGHDGLTEIEPRSEVAVIECAELPPRRTVMVDVPTTVCVLSRSQGSSAAPARRNYRAPERRTRRG